METLWYNPKTGQTGKALPEITGLNDNDGCYLISTVPFKPLTQAEQMTNYNVDAVFDAMFKPTSISTLTHADQKGEGWIDAVEFGEWLRTFEPLTKENNQWVLDCQISTKELYSGYLKDKSNDLQTKV